MSFRALALCFKMHNTTVGAIVYEVCDAIWNRLSTTHLSIPTLEDFLSIANEFNVKWNFPHCIGCIDGKHIRLRNPTHSGTMYYNYKHFFSIVLQGVSDANYKFIFVDVGAYGKQSDGGTYASSTLSTFINNENNLPKSSNLEGTSVEVPFFMLGDDAYPLKHNIMKPFSKRLLSKEERIYNYRHARARRCVENAFGIMVSKWRLLHKPIETTVDNAIKIVQCICLLHNLIIDKEGQPCAQTLISAASSYENDRNEKNVRTNVIRPFNRSSNLATFVRDTLKNYFISPIGSISFQEQYANVQK